MLLQLQSAGMTHGTALVVEDSPSDRLLLVRLLERLGCRADSVAGGADGVAAALTGAYDFVFMDVVMPGVDGLAATRLIHEHLGPRSPFVVAVTGLRSDQDRKRCAEAGMDYLLAKPVQRADLARLLDD